MSRLRGLAFQLSAAFAAVTVVTLLVVSLTAQRSTDREFQAYLEHARLMEQAMGGTMTGMMAAAPATEAAGAPPGLAEQQFQDRVSRALWIAGAVALVAGLALGLLLARQVVQPLKRVTQAVLDIASGDLSRRVEASPDGEVGALASAFNRMADSLQGHQRARRQLMTDIAHELRTPLTVVQANVEAMADSVVPADRANLLALGEEVRLLTLLVEDLRVLAQADTGRLEVDPQPTDLADLAKQVTRGYEAQAAQKGITLTVEPPERLLPDAWADPGRTTQVLHNLLTNALRYTPAGGAVTVRLTQQREALLVSVSDTGPGIPPEELPKVFDRFYRVDPSRARETGGSGLGLAIVKQLVEAQGGRVWAASTPGKGSDFTFQVPAAAGAR